MPQQASARLSPRSASARSRALASLPEARLSFAHLSGQEPLRGFDLQQKIRIDVGHNSQIERSSNLLVFVPAPVMFGTECRQERIFALRGLRPAAKIQRIAAIGNAEKIVKALPFGRSGIGKCAAGPGFS